MPANMIFRINHKTNFTVISRFTLEDKSLTWEARGLLAFLLSKPDSWKIILTHLIKSSPAGHDKTNRILNELIEKGYITKEITRNNHGHFSSTIYRVYEIPYSDYLNQTKKTSSQDIKTSTHKKTSINPKPVKLSLVKPGVEKPLAVKHCLVNKQINKETTTVNNELMWPDNINSNEKSSISTIAEHEDPAVVQKLLNEIAGQTVFRKGPVNLFYYLLKLEKEGTFVPAVSHRIESKREAKEKGELNYQRILEESERRAIEALNLKGNS